MDFKKAYNSTDKQIDAWKVPEKQRTRWHRMRIDADEHKVKDNIQESTIRRV